jgi:uncharacterized Zn-finger protein
MRIIAPPRGSTAASPQATEEPEQRMQPFETIVVDENVVACNGGGGALGHPRVFLNVAGATGRIECPYCSRLFVLRSKAGEVIENLPQTPGAPPVRQP